MTTNQHTGILKCEHCGALVPKARLCPYCRCEHSQEWIAEYEKWNGWFIFGVLVLCLFFIYQLVVKPEVKSEVKSEVKPNQLVTTNVAEWFIEDDLFIIADFKITNNTDKPVKDITVLCGGYSKTKTIIDHNIRIIYEEIKPKQTITINNFNMGFVNPNVKRLGCITTDFVSM